MNPKTNDRPNYHTLDRPLTIKAVSKAGQFEGYGAVFGNIDAHRDIIMPGAFTESLAQFKEAGFLPLMLWQHNIHEPVGVYSKMQEDDNGLALAGDLLVNKKVPEADKAHALMVAKAVRGLSIGFNVPRGGEVYNEEHMVWEISQIDLVEVSIVSMPANPLAQITDIKQLENPREFERLLRDVLGISHQEAKRLMAAGYDAMIQKRDVDGELVAAIDLAVSRMAL